MPCKKSHISKAHQSCLQPDHGSGIFATSLFRVLFIEFKVYDYKNTWNFRNTSAHFSHFKRLSDAYPCFFFGPLCVYVLYNLVRALTSYNIYKLCILRFFCCLIRIQYVLQLIVFVNEI